MNISKHITSHNTNNTLKATLAGVALAAITLTGCSKQGQWTMSGAIEGAEQGTALIVEQSANGRWFAIDTVETGKGGTFKIKADAPERPEIYRLTMQGRSVYFPIDSIDNLTLTTTADGFDTEFTLGGTPQAEMMGAFDRSIIAATADKGAAAVVTDSLFKRETGRKLLADPAGIAAYYIVNKKVDGRQLYDASNRFDRRIIGAVANAYEQKHPTDPRTKYLAQLFMTGRTTTVAAPEIEMFEINLYDRNGKLQSLSELAKANKVVLLSFANYGAEASTLYNNELHKLWTALHPAGLAIYQVSVGDEERHWRQSSTNVPWTSVYLPEISDGSVLRNYNVTVLPTTYLLVNGELRERIDNYDTLTSTVQKYL